MDMLDFSDRTLVQGVFSTGLATMSLSSNTLCWGKNDQTISEDFCLKMSENQKHQPETRDLFLGH